MSSLLVADLILQASSTGFEMHSVNNAHLFWKHCQSFCFPPAERDFRDETGWFVRDWMCVGHFKHTYKCTAHRSCLIDTTLFFEASHMALYTTESAFDLSSPLLCTTCLNSGNFCLLLSQFNSARYCKHLSCYRTKNDWAHNLNGGGLNESTVGMDSHKLLNLWCSLFAEGFSRNHSFLKNN